MVDGEARLSPAATESKSEAEQFAALRDKFGVLINTNLREFMRESVEPGRRAIDLGCGGGFMCEMFATKFDEVVGVDISRELLEIAWATRQPENVTYELTDLLEVTPATHGVFDLVYSAYTLHHLPDLGAGFETARQLVRPGGTLVLVHVVGRREGRSESWYRRQARRAMVLDILRRRRSIAGAREMYQVQTHPMWIRHIINQKHLSVEEFEAKVRAAFPSCEIIDMGRARMVVWNREPEGEE